MADTPSMWELFGPAVASPTAALWYPFYGGGDKQGTSGALSVATLRNQDPEKLIAMVKEMPWLLEQSPELQRLFPNEYAAYVAAQNQPLGDMPEAEDGGGIPSPEDDPLSGYGLDGGEMGGVDPSLQAQIDWWRQQFAGEQQMSQAELDWSKEMFARQQAFEREKLGQQQVQWSEEFGWDKMIEQARQQEAAQAMAFQQQQSMIAQQMARQQLMAGLAGPQDWLKAGIIGQGQMAQPQSWMGGFGVSPDSAMQNWRMGGDWASQAHLRPPGAQAFSQATPEQRAMMQGLFDWQAKPSGFALRGIGAPVAAASKAKRQ